jgi:RHS repeat-associated protein
VGADTHYYLTDGLGSTMALTDEDGDIVNTYDYDVFGAERASSGAQANDFTFAGEQADESTELQYLRARYYDSRSGSFISKDPLSRSPFWTDHPYKYVESNPVNETDPLGLAGGAGGRGPTWGKRTRELLAKCNARYDRCIHSWMKIKDCADLLWRCEDRAKSVNPREMDWEKEIRDGLNYGSYRKPRGRTVEEAVREVLRIFIPPWTGDGGLRERSQGPLVLPSKEGNFAVPCS